jgi:MerR family transcriptional regulator, thiopeptide resistance regulator
MATNAFTPLRVGEVAKRTGLSVRALHHYEEIGLFTPSQRSDSRYRLYDESDLLRLMQIKALRQLGFSLQEIRDLLATSDHLPLRTIEERIAAIDRQIESQRRVRVHLERIAAALRGGRSPSAAELIEAIEAMTMFEKYFTEEQQKELQQRGETVGEARIREVENEWPKLIAAVRDAVASGKAPDHPEVQQLAARWRALVQEFSGGNRGIEKSVATMYRNEPDVQQRMGLDAEIFDYIGKAMAAKS